MSKKKKINYSSAGVDIDAGNKTVEIIKDEVKSTFSSNVLTGIGGFGSLFEIGDLIKDYKNPVLVQSIDGVGTKTIIARKMNTYNTIGIDLLSAAANDIIVMGARPLTFLDYIANDKLKPEIINEIIIGIAKACRDTGVSLVGGETAEMPDTYLPNEHDLVGVITGVVEKDKIITGKSIDINDVVLGLPSSGLHTNGYSLARKLFFEIGNHKTDSIIPNLDKTVGETLLEPHINYTNPVQSLLNENFDIKGIAHITGGGLTENIPRILPEGCDVKIQKNSWPQIPVFGVMQSIGNLNEFEMYRTFNMGIGLVLIVSPSSEKDAKIILENFTEIYNIGRVVEGNRRVQFI
tara:strand:+ start:753 stop:1799 length:1047 start_codon:yes stop_codon:yes gene_type:complete